MTGQVAVEPVVVCDSSDCVLFGIPLRKGAKATADRTQPDKSSGSPSVRKDSQEDVISSGGNDSSKLNEPARFCPDTPGHQHSSTHRTLSGAETSVKRFEDGGNIANDAGLLPAPATSSDSSRSSSPQLKASTESSLRGKRSPGRSEGRLTEDTPELEVYSDASPTSREMTSPSTAPVPIQGQFEMLLRNSDADGDTRSSEMERTSDLSHTLSATQAARSGYDSPGNASAHSSQLDSSVASISPLSGPDSSPGKRSGLHSAPEHSEEDRSASSFHSNEASSAASGNSSPVPSSPSKRITWGKAKSYPGSETVSELEDERSVDMSAEFRAMRKQAAMVRAPVRPRRPPQPPPQTQRNSRDPRGRAKGMRRLSSKSRFDRD